jgi:hypothetical protein
MSTNTKPNPTVKLIKDFTTVLVLEGRDKLADGLYAVAEKVDISPEQEKFCETFRKELEQKKREKELANAKVAPAKA